MKKRYIVGLFLLVLIALTANVGNFGPVRPFIQLPGEAYPGTAYGLFGVGVLNTFLASVLVYLILFSLPLIFRPASRPAEQVPSSNGYNFLEMITETGYNFVEGIVGSQNVKAFFPYFMTFFMLVLTANLTSMIPGFDSIGFWEPKPEFYLHKAEHDAEIAGQAAFDELKEKAGTDLVKLQTLVAEKVNHPDFKAAALQADETHLTQLLKNDALAKYLDAEYLAIALGGEHHGEEAAPAEEEHSEEEAATEEHSEEATTEEHATDEGHTTVDVTTEEFFHTLAHEYEVQVDAKNTGDLKVDIIPGVLGFLQNASTDENGKKVAEADYTIVPFLRPAASDLTFTLALSLMTMGMVQIVGFRYLGARYLVKFFNFGGMLKGVDTFANNPIQGMISGIIDPAVGLIELISEFAKIISFAFRLLGAVFGGMVLLFVMANLAPIANIAFFGLEMFVGSIQALVFAMLSVIFINGATHAHGGHDEHHDDGHGHH
jgi:F0F1-type ATP synthase membrane subunit a